MRRIGISGHRTLTEPTRRAVAAEIAALLAARGEAVQGWTSLAKGADAIFAWAVLAAGGELVFVPPSEDVESDFTGTPLAQFRAARALAVRTEPTPYAERGEDAYLEAGKRIVDGVDEVFLVWDGQPAVGRGGTGDIYDYCVRTGTPVARIWPPGSQRPEHAWSDPGIGGRNVLPHRPGGVAMIALTERLWDIVCDELDPERFITIRVKVYESMESIVGREDSGELMTDRQF